MDNVILIIFFLNIESSYLQDIEQDSDVPADTIQFVLIGENAWRIKTYAIDHDVHVWSLGRMEAEKFEDLASTNTQKHYGDVLASTISVKTGDGIEDLKSQLKSLGLASFLEIGKNSEYLFWVPKEDVYKSKSTPQ